MAYQVLARKWRPKQFEEVIGQTHITRTLQNAIKQEKLAHAYLFTGTRGVGKTSIARLFAKAIRCENRKADANPCLVCAACRDIDAGNSMDYLEIDGASNNSVDDVRSLIENVNYLPTRGSYKIYVVDEVHMLTVNAFNALLKTLEEPPKHALFILATTDPQKLLGTVISRCQRYDFKNVSVETLKNHVLSIAKIEGINFSSPAIAQKLAELGKGSVRDTLSIFDQVIGLSGSSNISELELSQALGIAGPEAMRDFLSGLLKGEVKVCSDIYSQLLLENIDLKKFCDQLLEGLFQTINNIDDQKVLYKNKIINEGSLNGISIAEIFWIYETFAKDLNWALTSISPEKVVLILIQKLCLRRKVYKATGTTLTEVPQKGKPDGVLATKVGAPKIVEKSWVGFLGYLKSVSPATATNLEHGNLIEELNLKTDVLSIKVGFPEDAMVFKEFLEEKDVYARLKNHMADYFEMAIDKISILMNLLSLEEKNKKNFKTKLELDDEHRKNADEARRQKILNEPFLKEAEKIFNAKIDKIILK